MNIALFTYSTLPRGSVVHTAHLADALAAEGCDVTVYALDKEGRGFFRPLRARLCLVPASGTPHTTAELVKVRAEELANYVLSRSPPHDVWHAQDCLTTNGLLQARARGLPLRLTRTVHHVEAFADGYLAACQERSIQEADQCLAVSQAAAEDVFRGFGVRAAVVGNGVAFDRFAVCDPGRLARLATQRTGQGPVVLAVGGVEERKNTLRLLGAFVALRKRLPGAVLWLMGGASVLDHGAYRRAFDDALSSLPEADRSAVREWGVLPEADVPALFHLADVVALPSLHEGYGLVALEALAAGVPLLASNTRPFTEFLDEGCATLVDPLSEDAIAAGLVRALGNDLDKRAAGLARARSASWFAVARRHRFLYERMTNAADVFSRALA